MTAAVVSGPGEFSRRTDTGGQAIRQLPDAEYGEAMAYEESQKGAPLANGGSVPGPVKGLSAPGQAPAPVSRPPLPAMFDDGDPSVPVTTGAPMGAGANQIEGLPGTAEFTPVMFQQAMEPFMASDPTGILSEIVAALGDRGAY